MLPASAHAREGHVAPPSVSLCVAGDVGGRIVSTTGAPLNSATVSITESIAPSRAGRTDGFASTPFRRVATP